MTKRIPENIPKKPPTEEIEREITMFLDQRENPICLDLKNKVLLEVLGDTYAFYPYGALNVLTYYEIGPYGAPNFIKDSES